MLPHRQPAVMLGPLVYKETKMKPSQAAINAGMAAGRKALEDYSSFDSAMVPDSALLLFVTDVLTAGFAVSTPPATPPQSATGK